MKIENLTSFLNEAKADKGKIVRVSTIEKLGKNLSDNPKHEDFKNFAPKGSSQDEAIMNSKVKDSEGVFYMRLDAPKKIWQEGPLLIGNCFFSKFDAFSVRANIKDIQEPGKEWKYFIEDKLLESDIIGKTYFVEGTESGLMDINGNVITDLKEGDYIAISANFKLTADLEETVLYLVSKEKKERNFSARISTVKSFGNELEREQKDVIANWFSSQMGGVKLKIATDLGRWQKEHEGKFELKPWRIEAPGGSSEYATGFSAGPFLTKDQAEKALENIKDISEKSLFDKEKLKIELADNSIFLTLEKLIELAKANGIKTSMKQLLELKKGAVTSIKFGI